MSLLIDTVAVVQSNVPDGPDPVAHAGEQSGRRVRSAVYHQPVTGSMLMIHSRIAVEHE